MEILGFIFVGLIAWSLLRGMLNGAVKGHMMRSVDYAESIGVPRDFALKMISQNKIIKGAIHAIVREEPDVKALDVYKQNGLAVQRLYKQLQDKT